MLLKYLTKYFVLIILVYLLVLFIPDSILKLSDKLLIVSAIVAIFIVIDTVELLLDKCKVDITSCNKYCNIENNNKESFSPNIESSMSETKTLVKNTVQNDGTIIKYFSDSTYSISPPNDSNISRGLDRSTSGMLNNELKYDKNYSFIDLTTLPLPDNVNPDDLFEYGYSYLPPKDWYPVPPHPPICVTNKNATVCPTLTTGLGLDLKEWNESRRVTGPDNINTGFISDKLNSGR